MFYQPSSRVACCCLMALIAVVFPSISRAKEPPVRKPPSALADTACDLPLKGQHFTAAEVEQGTFAVDLSVAFTTDQIAQVESNVKACQSLISSRLLGFQDKGSILMSDKASMEGMRNIKAQVDTLKTLEAEKIDIRNTLGNDLAQVSLKGLYAVVPAACISPKPA